MSPPKCSLYLSLVPLSVLICMDFAYYLHRHLQVPLVELLP